MVDLKSYTDKVEVAVKQAGSGNRFWKHIETEYLKPMQKMIDNGEGIKNRRFVLFADMYRQTICREVEMENLCGAYWNRKREEYR